MDHPWGENISWFIWDGECRMKRQNQPSHNFLYITLGIYLLLKTLQYISPCLLAASQEARSSWLQHTHILCTTRNIPLYKGMSNVTAEIILRDSRWIWLASWGLCPGVGKVLARCLPPLPTFRLFNCQYELRLHFFPVPHCHSLSDIGNISCNICLGWLMLWQTRFGLPHPSGPLQWSNHHVVKRV